MQAFARVELAKCDVLVVPTVAYPYTVAEIQVCSSCQALAEPAVALIAADAVCSGRLVISRPSIKVTLLERKQPLLLAWQAEERGSESESGSAPVTWTRNANLGRFTNFV